MDPDDTMGEIPPPPTSRVQSQPRVRRRAGKRNGPPEFQFLTATDPSQFKDEHAKRSVRSQAMIQYRYRAEQQRQKRRERPASGAGETTKPSAASSNIAVMKTSPPWQSRPNRLIARMLNADEGQDPLYSSMSSSFSAFDVDEAIGEVTEPASTEPPIPLVRSARYRRIAPIFSIKKHSQNPFVYEESDEHESVMMRILCGKLGSLQNLGDGVDPFSVLPQFENPELDSLSLVQTTHRIFVSTATTVKWIPILLANPKVMLSGVALTATWNDMRAGRQSDSKRTMLVKSEIIGYINEMLRDPETQFSDLTLMTILHLLGGEMWTCNEKVLRIHESGVTRLISHRGGIESLGGNGVIGQVATACCYHIDIFCEAIPQEMFRSLELPSFAPVDDTVPLPESPLFSPRDEFHTIANSRYCSEVTYELLCDMRDLTQLFLSHHENTLTDNKIPLSEHSARTHLSSEEYDSKIAEIGARLSALPSAATPHTQVTNDWVYESCRIAAIIYTTAITFRMSFCDASYPGRSPFVLASPLPRDPSAVGTLQSGYLSEALLQALEKSDMGEIWGGMSGVLYWVALVGAAAARTPSTITTSQSLFSEDEHAMWIRRCLIMTATRAMIILIFNHPVPILIAQRKLLRVQELTSKT